jgi:hypothetical protein
VSTPASARLPVDSPPPPSRVIVVKPPRFGVASYVPWDKPPLPPPEPEEEA